MSKSISEKLKKVLNRLVLVYVVVIIPVIGWKFLVTPFLETSKLEINFDHPEIFKDSHTVSIEGKRTFGIEIEPSGSLSSIFYTKEGSPFRNELPDRIGVVPGSQSVPRGAVALRQSKPTTFMGKKDLENTSVFTHNTSLAIDNASETGFSVTLDDKNLKMVPAKSHVVFKVKAGNHRIELINANKQKRTYKLYLGVEKGTHDKVLNSGADLYVLNIDGENTYRIIRAQYRR